MTLDRRDFLKYSALAVAVTSGEQSNTRAHCVKRTAPGGPGHYGRKHQ